MKKILKLFVIFTVLFVPFVQAKTLNHSYAEADENVYFTDDANGSIALAGQEVSSKGNIFGVNFLAGYNVEFSGSSDYLVAAGNNVNVEGTINNDAVIAGNIINIKAGADFQRDVVIAGSDIKINGNIDRNVTIYGAKVNISEATISGNAKIYAEEITVDERSTIGELSYPKDAEVSIGSQIKNIIVLPNSYAKEEVTFFDVFVDKVWSFMSLVLIFAILSLAFPKVFDKIQKKYKKIDFNRATEIPTKGLVFMILVPILSLILITIPFGVPLSLMLIFAYIITLLYLSKVFAGYLIGYKLWQKYIDSDMNVLLVGILGLAVLFVLDLIPIVRMISTLGALLFGVGVLVELLPSGKSSSKKSSK